MEREIGFSFYGAPLGLPSVSSWQGEETGPGPGQQPEVALTAATGAYYPPPVVPGYGLPGYEVSGPFQPQGQIRGAGPTGYTMTS